MPTYRVCFRILDSPSGSMEVEAESPDDAILHVEELVPLEQLKENVEGSHKVIVEAWIEDK